MQKGSSESSMYPAFVKNLEIESGETWIGHQGKNSRAAEKGNNSITPQPPSVRAASKGWAIAHPAHITRSSITARVQRRPATTPATTAHTRARENQEGK